MTLYPVFLVVAAATVASPGPGVVLTLTNALRYGFPGTFAGILGIAVGGMAVAGISATGLGVLLATSAAAFTAIKLVGAAAGGRPAGSSRGCRSSSRTPRRSSSSCRSFPSSWTVRREGRPRSWCSWRRTPFSSS
jgi:hypothetical protein